jgi:large subunit ribosomal protein L18
VANLAFARRRKRDNYKMSKTHKHVLSVFRSNKHLYAYVSHGDKTLFSVSNLGKEVPEEVKSKNNKATADWVGKKVAEQLQSMKVDTIVFNKAGYKFHGKVKNLIDAVRERGIQC